jgi:GGDEF domain-containing protein
MAVFIQRYSDATKSYKLDLKSKTDDLTGIANMRKFERDSRKFMQDCISRQKVPVYLVFDIRK